MLIILHFGLSLLSVQPLGVLADETTGLCSPVTWTKSRGAGKWPADATGMAIPPAGASTPIVARIRNRPAVRPGELNCRFWANTYDDPDHQTCIRMAEVYGISLEKLFFMNPTLLPDCSNIEPNAKYCVAGFIEPLRSTDGFCGPHHNNATCLGTDKQCCNAETWTCGNSEEDCANGTCYEGACIGDKQYGTDGTCGWQHSGRLCAGKWGDCCHRNGTCGTGSAFCAREMCQSGNCAWDHTPSSESSGLSGLCGLSCPFGVCPLPCTCSNPGARAIPALGYNGGHSAFCRIVCNHNYCLEEAGVDDA